MYHVEIVSRLAPAHVDQVSALIEAAARSDGHAPLGEHKFLRLQRGDDLAAAVLAFQDGELAGYAHAVTYGERDDRRASCEFVVHPGFRRRGVGRQLLSQAIVHASTQFAGRLDVWAYNDRGAGRRMAVQFGFRPARRLLHLHRHMRDVPGVVVPAGVAFRAFHAGVDDGPWLALNNRIFATHPENGAWTREDLQARVGQPWFEADDFLVVEVEGEMAGFCWLKVEERPGEGRVGEVYVIGVGADHRGRGLGRLLLARALEQLRARAVEVAAIYVDESNTAAVGLYEASGFHYHHVDVCYTRALRGQASHGAPDGRAAA